MPACALTSVNWIGPEDLASMDSAFSIVLLLPPGCAGADGVTVEAVDSAGSFGAGADDWLAGVRLQPASSASPMTIRKISQAVRERLDMSSENRGATRLLPPLPVV
jgi:hypothetical protein